MPNIPMIHQGRVSGSPRLRRTNKVIASEHANDNTPTIQRRLERRRNRNRRQKQINILFDRRHRGVHRRRHVSTKATAAESACLGDNVGKHINTTA